MKSLRTTYNPLTTGIERYLDRMLREHDRFRTLFADRDDADNLTEWTPAVDIREEDNRFVIRADLPGVDPAKVDVMLEDGVLSIRGERKESKEETEGDYHRSERFHGTFFRRFTLPDTVDASKVEARSDHGVLQIVIPKSEKSKAKPKRIQVKG